MQTKVINPYRELELKIADAFDFTSANLPANPTFDQLNTVVLTGIFGSAPGNPLDGDGNVDAAEQAKMRDTMREMKHSMKNQ